VESNAVSRGNGTNGAGDLDGGVLVGDTELCCIERNASGAGRNCEIEVKSIGAGGIDTGAGFGVGRLWRKR
jgi:hypothetical protein